jgi:hypothetical protein
METQAGTPEQATPLDQGGRPDDANRTASSANGMATDHGHARESAPRQHVGRRVTPSEAAEIHDTPVERAERKRHLREVLESFRAKTPGEGREPTEEEILAGLFHDELMVRLNRDYTMSVVPPDFLLHEPPDLRAERIRRTQAGLAALREGDPDEQRETLEALLAALDDDSPSSHEAQEARSSE